MSPAAAAQRPRPRIRDPQSCRWRTKRADESDGPACGFVARMLGSEVDDEACRVSEQDCNECCRYATPDPGILNPGIAGVVVSTIDRLLSEPACPVRRQVALYQARQFVQRRYVPAGSGAVRSDRTAAAVKNRRDRSNLRLGLVGPSFGLGLAHQNRDLARNLPLDRWLVSGNPDPAAVSLARRVDFMPRPPSVAEMEAWLDGLDIILFIEQPAFEGLTAAARRCGACVVCVPNWEWLHPGQTWLDDVDLMLCPVQRTAGQLEQWKRRFGFSWRLEYLPWPIDLGRIGYRPRLFCRSFVYVNGLGGRPAALQHPPGAVLNRKGLDVVLAAAELVPQVPLCVYAVADDLPVRPKNVEVRPLPADNARLYADGDVCVLPSRWEGLGLPLLECQAAGMPLITTDAAPMNEHAPWRTIPVQQEAVAWLTPAHGITAAPVCPEDLARVLHACHGRWIGFASLRARRYVAGRHNWPAAARSIRDSLNQLVFAS